VTLFGLERLDAPEQDFLNKSPMRRISAADVQAKGAAEAARATLTQMHADARQVVLHIDTDVIAQEEFPGVNVPGSGGLSFADVRGALMEFVKNPNLLGLDVAQYNPDKDGAGAQKLVDLLVEALTARLAALAEPAAAAAEPGTTQPDTSVNTAAASPQEGSPNAVATSNEATPNEASSNEPPEEVSSKETSA
jgi:Arginase family